MIAEHPLDAAACYEQVRAQMIELVRSLDGEQVRRRVAATPAWTVHDVLAHVVAITADLNAQRFGDGGGDAWTARQVAERSACSVDDLVQEWEREAPRFVDGLRLFGYELGSHYTGDLLMHLGDVQATLGLDHLGEGEPALVAAVDFYLDSFHESLVAVGAGPVAWTVAGETVVVGADLAGAPVASVRTTGWGALRSLGGRRTAAQIAALDWTGDPSSIIGLVSRYPLPEQPTER